MFCVSVSDNCTGEAVRLLVVRKPDTSLAEADSVAHCRAALEAYEVPKTVRFVDILPKSEVGKILRRDLRFGLKYHALAAIKPGDELFIATLDVNLEVVFITRSVFGV